MTVGRKTHHNRGKNTLTHKIKGDKVEEKKQAGKALFEKKAKSSEPDNVGRKFRPEAHAPVQQKRMKRERKLVKKLSEQVI